MVKCTVFTKPWPKLGAGQLAEHVRMLGFDGAEVPVRPGYQVEPDDVRTDLPRLAEAFRSEGVEVSSVASSLDEPIFEACAEAGIDLIRVMAPAPSGQYVRAEESTLRLLAGARGLCQEYGVRVGVQEHYGEYINSAQGLRGLLSGIDSEWIGAVWDAAHDALAGNPPETGLELVWDRLFMVNLKNAYYERVNGPEADAAEWRRHFTTATHGLASWRRVAAELAAREYTGVVCLTAEYDEPADVTDLVQKDLAYVRRLCDEVGLR